MLVAHGDCLYFMWKTKWLETCVMTVTSSEAAAAASHQNKVFLGARCSSGLSVIFNWVT